MVSSIYLSENDVNIHSYGTTMFNIAKFSMYPFMWGYVGLYVEPIITLPEAMLIYSATQPVFIARFHNPQIPNNKTTVN